MARRPRTQRLNVYLNARLVGRLEKAVSGAVSFAYDADWRGWEGAMPVSTSLPLSTQVYRGAQVTNVFENLLPDADRVRRNVAERLGADGIDAFALLSVTGRDCVGALQFLSPDDDPGAAGAVDGVVMSDADIAALVRQLRVNPLGLDPEDDDFRISIAGAQDKTALLKKGGTWYRPAGTTATTHILKPAIGVVQDGIAMADSVQNEYACLAFCGLLGLDVAEAEIVSFEDQLVLSVKRFDRLWTEDGRLLRLPQEDFCQALSVPSTLKYQRDGGPGMLQVLERLKESDQANEDRYNFFKSQVVFWLLGATDGHAKNFSIALQPGGGFRMTRLYDVLTAQPVVDAGQVRQGRYKMAMSIGDNNRYLVNQVTARHFEQAAAAAGLPVGTFEKIRTGLNEAVPAALDALGNMAGNKLPEALVDSIKGGVRARIAVLNLEE